MAARKTAVKKTTEATEPTVETQETEVTPEVEATEAEAPTVVAAGFPTGKRAIERIHAHNGTWHCPFCDNANESKLTTCGKCLAVRVGDEATR